VNKLHQIHAQHCERLSCTVVQFPRYVAAFFILRSQQTPRELSDLF
jgi:hypothetical protein